MALAFLLWFFAFAGITGCGSVSLKLCASDAASSWSKTYSPDSQCIVGGGGKAKIDF